MSRLTLEAAVSSSSGTTMIRAKPVSGSHPAGRKDAMPEEPKLRSDETPEFAEAMRERGALLGLGYRLLGSFADAEDAVQETYVRWYRLDESRRREIENPRAWLMKTTSRIALDMIKSARAKREQYVGEWLPEPLPGSRESNESGAATWADPADRVTLDDSVSMALLVVLESMTPAERVAFVLHDAFRFTFPEIAEIVGRSPAACRQLASSARKRVDSRKRVSTSANTHAAAVRTFKEAWESGDLAGLIAVLDPEATAVTDGGGIVSAALEPLYGREVIAGFFLGVLDRQPDLEVREEKVNGEPGLVVRTSEGHTLAVLAFGCSGPGGVDQIWAVRNPRKLENWSREAPGDV